MSLIRTGLKWIVALGLLVILGVGAYFVHVEMQAERLLEGEEEKVESPLRARNGVVTLTPEEAARMGLAAAQARVAQWAEHVEIHGQVVVNPRAVVEVRAPYAGTLREDGQAPWPAPGRWVKKGDLLGSLEIRVSVQERWTVLDNLKSARIKAEGAAKILALQRERVSRIEKVSKSQIVPGQQLDDAKVLLADAETQVALAQAAVELWKKALDEMDHPSRGDHSSYRYQIRAAGDGEVVDLLARPGMAVEAGGLLLRLVDDRRPLVRLDLPVELLEQGPPQRLELAPIPARMRSGGWSEARSHPGRAMRVWGVRVGPAASVDLYSQRIGYWYEPELGTNESEREPEGLAAIWRPGLQVKALAPLPGRRPRAAVAVPADALLFWDERALVYIQRPSAGYERRFVKLLGREEADWILELRQPGDKTGLEPGETIVTRGAQVLLSEELRAADGEL